MALLTPVEVASAAVAAAWVVASYPSTTAEWISALPFFVTAFTLGLFDVWLPLGDTADMTTAVALAAVVLARPAPAIFAIALSRVLLMVARADSRTVAVSAEAAARRVLVMVASLVMLPHAATVVGRYGAYPLAVVETALFFGLDVVLAQIHRSVRLRAPLLVVAIGYLRFQGLMVAAQVSVAALTLLLYDVMNAWSLVVTFGLLLVTRQSFSLLVEVRKAYRATVEALIRAIEAQDPRRRGHAERVAQGATEVGRMLGMHGRRLEALTYAALFHDVGRMDEDGTAPLMASSSEVLSAVGFLSESVPILRILEGATGSSESEDEDDLVAAYVIAHMSALDDRNSGLEPAYGADSSIVGGRLYSRTRRRVDRTLRRADTRSEVAATLAASPTEGAS